MTKLKFFKFYTKMQWEGICKCILDAKYNELEQRGFVAEDIDKREIVNLTLKNTISNTSQNLISEILNRTSSDDSIINAISHETSIRSVFNNILLTKIDNEDKLRVSSDLILSNKFCAFLTTHTVLP